MSTSDDVNRALSFTLGEETAPSSDPHLRHASSQGTFHSIISGGVIADAENVENVVSTAATLLSNSPLDNIAPTCLMVSDDESLNILCLGCVGTKGEKWCSKRKLGSGELDTCGTSSHAKKAVLDNGHLYFWDSVKNVGFQSPSLSMTHGLAVDVYGFRGETLTRLQVSELFDLVRTGAVVTFEELMAAKFRVLNPTEGVSFTPRKKPRFSTSDWDYNETEALPAIAEVAMDQSGAREHMDENWNDMVRTVEVLKASTSRQMLYEREIERLGDDVDTLRSTSCRLHSLVGAPSDGIRFDLYQIVHHAESCLLELEDTLTKEVTPKLNDLATTTERVEKDLAFFKTNIGLDAANKISSMETSIHALQSAATPHSGIDVVRLQEIMVKQVIPGLKDLWQLYSLVSRGPNAICTPGDRSTTAGDYLIRRLDALGDDPTSNGTAVGNALVLRIKSLEDSFAGLQNGHGMGNGLGGTGASQYLCSAWRRDEFDHLRPYSTFLCYHGRPIGRIDPEPKTEYFGSQAQGIGGPVR
jgi:hypothetical protein